MNVLLCIYKCKGLKIKLTHTITIFVLFFCGTQSTLEENVTNILAYASYLLSQRQPCLHLAPKCENLNQIDILFFLMYPIIRHYFHCFLPNKDNDFPN